MSVPTIDAAGAGPLGRIAGIQARCTALRSAATGTAVADDFARLLSDAVAGSTTSSALPLTTGSSGATTGDGVGAQVTDAALELVGVPYVWGGNDPATGLDCSGFVRAVFGRFGLDLPRTSREQAQVGAPVASLADARPGDVLAFGQPVHHVGIYLGDGKMVHAAGTGRSVEVSDLAGRTPTAIRRLVGTAGSGAAPGAGLRTPSIGGWPSLGGGTGGVASSGAGVPLGGGISPAVRAHAGLFAAAAERWGVPAGVLAAVAQTESGGDPRAVSSKGALSLMQFMPDTARAYGIDPLDPAQAIDAAAKYLASQRDRFGSMELALASYNAGPGAVARAGGVAPPQTTRYIAKVLSLAGGAA